MLLVVQALSTVPLPGMWLWPWVARPPTLPKVGALNWQQW